MHAITTRSLALSLLVSACMRIGTPVQAEEKPKTARLETPIPDVVLPTAAGKPFALHSLKGRNAIVAVFLSFECPMSRDYAPLLADLARAYRNRGVTFFGVGVGEDDAAQVAKSARELDLPFPVFADAHGRAADAFAARVTPEAFLLDRNLVLRYHGRIDDAYVARLRKRSQATRNDLRQALDELLAGKPVTEPATEAFGCAIPRGGRVGRPAPCAGAGSVTFHRDVLPILQDRCQSCHRPGAVGPFALLTYRQAVTWAADIKEYTQNRKMPPWKPTAGGPFHGERRLSDRELATLAAWVDGGTPEGDARDAPPARTFSDGWQLGEPDLVLRVNQDFELGARGADVYRYFVLPTNLPRDVYVSAVEVRPGNRRAVHHAVLFVDRHGRARRLEQKERVRPRKETEVDRGPGYCVTMAVLPGFLPEAGLSGWAPGMVLRRLPDDVGYLLPKGADVVLQVHYHRTGRVEKDRTAVGLYFTRNPSAQWMRGVVVPGNFLMIPAGAERYRVRGSITVLQDCRLHSIMPHMHLLGREMKVVMIPPGGPQRTLVAVRDWDFNWQEMYYFTDAIAVKANTRFTVEGLFDNSTKNFANPNRPPRPVLAGVETTNEMCAAFLEVSADRPGPIRFEIQVRIPGLGGGSLDIPAWGF